MCLLEDAFSLAKLHNAAMQHLQRKHLVPAKSLQIGLGTAS